MAAAGSPLHPSLAALDSMGPMRTAPISRQGVSRGVDSIDAFEPVRPHSSKSHSTIDRVESGSRLKVFRLANIDSASAMPPLTAPNNRSHHPNLPTDEGAGFGPGGVGLGPVGLASSCLCLLLGRAAGVGGAATPTGGSSCVCVVDGNDDAPKTMPPPAYTPCHEQTRTGPRQVCSLLLLSILLRTAWLAWYYWAGTDHGDNDGNHRDPLVALEASQLVD